ncbi:MAG: protoporphyrinogen oxidase [Gemmatimonadales bacterium]
MRRIVVIGGGISGLAAAWTARATAGADTDILVLERGAAIGGKAQTVVRDGWLVETGPTGYLSTHAEVERLVDAAGLRGEVVRANASAARRFVYHAGRMRRITSNPFGLVVNGILSPSGAFRILREPWIPRRAADDDESVWAFANRRLGSEVADRLVAPMAQGVFAGDARQLSLRAAFPKMAALERDYGSLIRALIARRGRMAAGRLQSFRSGMQALPRALATSGAFTVRCNSDVNRIERNGEQWLVTVADAKPVVTDVLIVAADVSHLAQLISPVAPTAARQVESIPAPHVAVVALGFTDDAAGRVPQGFGVLIRRGEGVRALGHLWDSRIFPGRAPENGALLRAIYGGAVDPVIADVTGGELLSIARDEAKKLYGIAAEPAFTHVTRWAHAIPQYVLGHRGRVAQAEEALQLVPGVLLAGSALHGISFGDAVASGVRAGMAAVRLIAAL